MKDTIKNKTKEIGNYALNLVLWLFVGLLVGLAVGGVSTVFSFALTNATKLREENMWIIYLLPVAGLVIAGLYKITKSENDRGTNLIMESISKNEDVPIKMAPLIFISTVLTHMFGGSAGREGAALQLGGSLGNFLGKILRFDEKDKKVFIMCGMSAAFAALFGTPMAAAVFAIEAATVGVMYFSSLLPCVVSALVASRFSANLGISAESFPLKSIPKLSVTTASQTLLLAVACGLVSIMFCLMMKYVKKGMKSAFKNAFVRIVAGALIFLGITALVGGTDFYGAGIGVIDEAVIEGDAHWYAFILKMFLTALILGSGFKGGEIVPAFYVGATFGCVFGKLIGLSPNLAAAMGMTALFCGITNCPISSMLISFELFGFESVPYILIATAVAYVSSGYASIYSSQNIIHSKFSPKLRTVVVDEQKMGDVNGDDKK